MNPKYCENIIVGVVYKRKFNWYITNKELWHLDYDKEYKSWKECYNKMGRSEKQFNYDIGSFEEFCSNRWGIQILNTENANIFFDKIEKYKVSVTKLKNMFINAGQEKYNYYPSLYVNFDKKHFYSYFPEPENFENFVPDDWIGDYLKFYELIPKDKRYWE